MKKTIIKFVNLFLASMMLVGCDCCDDSQIDIDYTLVCSEDLLEYATPQVTYTENGKDPRVISIAENEWEEVKDNDVTSTTTIVINGETITKVTKLVKWTKHVHYGKFSIVDDVMEVTYKPKETAKDIIVLIDQFKHDLSANLDFVDEDGDRYTSTFIYNETNINIGQRMSLEELINSYKDRRGFHVESNGNYSQIK